MTISISGNEWCFELNGATYGGHSKIVSAKRDALDTLKLVCETDGIEMPKEITYVNT